MEVTEKLPSPRSERFEVKATKWSPFLCLFGVVYFTNVRVNELTHNHLITPQKLKIISPFTRYKILFVYFVTSLFFDALGLTSL
jgi:hypothetical protein